MSVEKQIHPQTFQKEWSPVNSLNGTQLYETLSRGPS